MLQSGTSVDEGISVLVVIMSGVLGKVVRKNVTGYSLDDSLLTSVVTSSTMVMFSEGTSLVTGVTVVTG
jgi:hypothetical protein